MSATDEAPPSSPGPDARAEQKARRVGEKDARLTHEQRIADHGKALLGVQFSEMEVEGVLGHASNGTVLHCKARGLEVAVKILHTARDALSGGDQHDEHRVLQGLNPHWNIVSVLAPISSSRLTEGIVQYLPDIVAAAVSHGGRTRYNNAAALVMELLPMNLATLLQSRRESHKRLSSSDILAISTQVADAVHHLQEAGVVHGDLKLENVLVDPRSKRAVIVDFSCAAKRGGGPGDLNAEHSLRPFANTELTLGNEQHLAPEVVEGVRRHLNRGPGVGADQRVAISLKHQPAFAVGVLMYELAMDGKHPISDSYPHVQQPSPDAAQDGLQTEHPTNGNQPLIVEDASTPPPNCEELQLKNLFDTVEAKADALREATTSRYAAVVSALLAFEPQLRMTLPDAIRLLRGVKSSVRDGSSPAQRKGASSSKPRKGRRKAGNIAFGGHGDTWKNTTPRERMGNNKLLRAKREQAALLARLNAEPKKLKSGKAKKERRKAQKRAKVLCGAWCVFVLAWGKTPGHLTHHPSHVQAIEERQQRQERQERQQDQR